MIRMNTALLVDVLPRLFKLKASLKGQKIPFYAINLPSSFKLSKVGLEAQEGTESKRKLPKVQESCQKFEKVGLEAQEGTESKRKLAKVQESCQKFKKVGLEAQEGTRKYRKVGKSSRKLPKVRESWSRGSGRYGK